MKSNDYITLTVIVLSTSERRRNAVEQNFSELVGAPTLGLVAVKP